MAIVYFDSSALVKLVVDEVGSDIAALLWDGCDAAVTSRLAYPEVRAALAAAGRDHRLEPSDLHLAENSWERIWSAVRPVEFTASIAEDAGFLAGEHALRGTDAVHLASALAMDDGHPIFAAWDRRLRSGALDVDLRVVPEAPESSQSDS
jgi:predicted nucleic acid-binding protein